MTSNRARPSTRRAPSQGRNVRKARKAGSLAGGRTSRLVVAGLAVVVVAALAIALAVGGSSDSGTDAAGAAVTVEGQALSPLPNGGRDPAVGSPMPTLSGANLDGRPMTIAADGRPKMILFLAHWCPHCRAEVPVVQDWVDGGGLPEGVELVSVATANDPRRPNFPAADWLDREGWTAPVLLDDADNDAATAAGLSAYPFWVLVDGNGTVLARTTGELTPSQLTAMADRLAASER